ncbi:phosphodiester glycosidase family protein [Gemmatimonas groenlandica]|uniref:Phosphodiester glycosidase family protein n=1 Tax=Gemmatimonas groenlandica TaxID=2732249 RepID=A0A6M4ISS3_9BACT|nr:phosphodiester glycosidase family protein [Gemmatimonas groenlandica]QJR37783.1 phosphodiester glycosidase family protein [Gemmatimonas groenlandica]
MRIRAFVWPLLAALPLLSACRTVLPGRAPRFPFVVSPSVADTIDTEVLSNAVRLHRLVNVKAPWRAWVLDVNMSACVSVQAVKGEATAVGRNTTSVLLSRLPAASHPIAAVNADFFLFAPPGVLTNAHIERGTVIAGPGPNVLLGYDAQRGLFIDSVRVSGAVTSTHGTVDVQNWNRPAANRAGLVDARWGVPLDTLVRTRALRLEPIVAVRQDTSAGRYVVRAARAGDTLVYGDTLLLIVPPALRARAVAGDTVTVQRRLTPYWPRETVGGRGVLLVDSVVGADVDREGNAGFQGLNPRTAAGIARVGNSQRLLLAVIDGRQPGYSVGMTLRQTAELLQSLGAQSAINLDGGGSSAMIVRDNATGALRVRNKPSDPTGERPVGNGLAVLGVCAGR